jgi:chromosome partitioning protein
MRIISVLSQKGGAGKTTASVHLAVAYGGAETFLVDCDPQKSAEKWATRRDNDTPKIISYDLFAAHGPEKIVEFAKDNGAKALIFDGQPRASAIEVRLAQIANVVIIPARASILDLEAIEVTINIAEAAHKKIVFLLSAAQPRQKEYAEAVQWLQRRTPGASVATMCQRVIYSRALSSGSAVSELSDSEARDANAEIEHLKRLTEDLS